MWIRDRLRPGSDGVEPTEGILGDVVLCPSVAQAQAAEAGHTPAEELLLLTTHGILHLLGFDHAEPAAEKELSLIHISEPTRLLSLLYAVFCLKKKKIPLTSPALYTYTFQINPSFDPRAFTSSLPVRIRSLSTQ